MNPNDHDREQELQDAAERAERLRLPAGEPGVDHYRLVARAVRAAPMPALPADFAVRVAARARAIAESAGVEEWLTTTLMLAFCLGAAVYLYPSAAPMIATLRGWLPELPWPSVLATGVALAAAWSLDRGLARWSGEGGLIG